MTEFPSDLVRSAREGDPHAREELFARAAAFTETLLRARRFDPEVIDDLIQDVAVRLLRMLVVLKDDRSLGNFVRLAVSRALGDYFRRRKASRRVWNLLPNALGCAHAPERNGTDFTDLRERLVTALEGLPPTLRLLYLLFARRYSIPEIAAVLRISTATVKRRKARLMRELAKALWHQEPPLRVTRHLRR